VKEAVDVKYSTHDIIYDVNYSAWPTKRRYGYNKW